MNKLAEQNLNTTVVNECEEIDVNEVLPSSKLDSIDTRVNLTVARSIISPGNLKIKNYIRQNEIDLLKNAINDLTGRARDLLVKAFNEYKSNNTWQASKLLKTFNKYIEIHPELTTDSVEILLQFLR